MKLLYLIIFILTILLFVGGPEHESYRIIKTIWDMGHVVLFSAFTYVLLNLPSFRKFNYKYIFLLTIFLGFSIGLIIEVLQVLVERDFEVKDIFSDVLGATIGYLIYESRQTNIKIKQNIIMAILSVLLIVALVPLIKVFIDEYNMRQEFPQLANFESAYQLNRWDLHLADISYSKKLVIEGDKALKIVFNSGGFSDITLQYFVKDWSGYTHLQFELYNAEKKIVFIDLKIYDEEHINNAYVYNDRYNKKIFLQSGWNKILIPLSEIISSPKNRKLDITKVKSFSLFLSNLSKPTILYLDNIRLIK